ncbi:YidH family protein [Rhodalgimonas zhirmunskyi]|uniref:DUF202 domain-containing protein n=1 Tax=Rhodalgimonas zhirmunskyi TaxID=2964767 RepID=A0AAJ1UDL3_9RHOB|nr:DUF202 domain-containing protein [Rhodoalgimonas zhirmunskyi]MDQ2094032.1 DUF202 domain-containing protein [Rhodoalgimonas zhirmunskyi]
MSHDPADHDSDENAEKRTNWAEDRTLLAAERTFAAWLRTGLASVGIAIGLQAIYSAVEPTWIAKAVATGFLLTAIVTIWLANHAACRTYDRLNQGDAISMSPRFYRALSVALTAVVIAAGVVLWLA